MVFSKIVKYLIISGLAFRFTLYSIHTKWRQQLFAVLRYLQLCPN